jgi:uncharacterized protein YcfL
MKTHLILVLLLVAVCGCSSQTSTTRIPSGAPAVVFTDCRRDQDSTFPQRERDIIASARRHLEQSDKRPIDAYYRVKHTADGFEVFVIYVTGYTGSQPVFMPGGHCTVLLREDGSVIRVLGGA